jgi:hypothetical protein
MVLKKKVMFAMAREMIVYQTARSILRSIYPVLLKLLPFSVAESASFNLSVPDTAGWAILQQRTSPHP